MTDDLQDIYALSDCDLAVIAQQQRRKALRGDRHAHGLAHEAEKELRRRGGYHIHYSPLAGPITLASLEGVQRPWWRFWA
ncbi:hypothetical protein [Variovorax sp. UC122_21]|uniref:hypothetical protein n=1 Tax=Variovorax TaxID=34072 RepID=UPI00193171FC|nr:hypothetical protein INQ48_35400 [Variovorax paradoxus]